MDLVEGCVARSDYGYGAGGDAGAVPGCQEAGGAQGFEFFDDIRKCGFAVGFDVDVEVEGLARVGVVDATKSNVSLWSAVTIKM